MARKRKSKKTEVEVPERISGDQASFLMVDEIEPSIIENEVKPDLTSILADIEKAYGLSRDIRVNRILERALKDLRNLANA